jgi:hypothetical protein
VSAFGKLPRAARMALVGGLLIVLALVAKGLAGGADQPIGVSSVPVTRRDGINATSRNPSTTVPLPPPNPGNRNPFAPAK